MEPTITITLGSLYTAILAICAAVTAVSAAVAVVANIVKKLKSPDAARDKKLAEHDSQFEEIDRRLKEYDSFLRSDKTRIEALETADYVVWKQGYVTRKGEIVKIDLDGDDVLDYAMYDGGRPETSLSVGKIDGWYKVTSAGVKTHTITRNADKTFLLTPIEAAT